MLTQTWQAGGLGKAAVDGGAVWPDFSSGGGCRNYDLHVALWSVVTAGTMLAESSSGAVVGGDDRNHAG